MENEKAGSRSVFFILFALCLHFPLSILHFPLKAQNALASSDDIKVQAQGIGVERTDALQDALRAAVSQAAGVAVKSATTVENFMVVQDAIATNATGYITSYSVVSEGKAPTGYQVTISAMVSQKPLKADAALLSKSLGGIRWLAAYEPAAAPDAASREACEFALDRINEFLANRKYRYIERRRFEQLKKEAQNLFQDGQKEDSGAVVSYAQQLGLQSGAQFVFFIKKISQAERSEAFETRTASRVTVAIEAFDNCTGEGLGTVNMEGDWQTAANGDAARSAGVTQAINSGMPKLLEMVNTYIGDWVNNGTPFELRFYKMGGFRDMRELRKQLSSDPLFGGELEVTAADNYQRLMGTFKRKPEEMADRVLDIADGIPALASQKLDVKLIFGRQINFAPTAARIPELEKAAPTGGIQQGGGAAPKNAPPMPMPKIGKTLKTTKKKK